MFRVWLCVAGLMLGSALFAQEAPGKPTRILLIGQGPDGHPVGTHEYRSGMQFMATMLSRVDRVQVVVVSADGEWKDGPTLLDGADAAVLFVSQGAKWIRATPTRLAAFQALAKRGGGLTCLHWGMGTKDAEDIPDFVSLFGGCHGGPDRRYKVVDVKTEIAAPLHPILTRVEPVQVHEEFYYALKLPQEKERHVALIKAPIGNESYTVAFAWERPTGGRSFGFTGLHFHDNWKIESYRRLMAQGVLWTTGRSIPSEGLNVSLEE